MNLIVIATATVVIAFLLPLALGLRGAVVSRQAPEAALPPRLDWALSVRSTLLYTLAFNLTFLVQELFLVIPKALTPGLRPTLFHNNHTWEGTHPLAHLFQGTGALATMLVAFACLWRLRRGPLRSGNGQLLLVWLAYCGLLMALPQFAIGALSGDSDLGMAMGYFGLGEPTRLALGLVALAAIPFAALQLARPLLSLADQQARIATPRARTRFMFCVATMPALAGAVLSIAFRVPRDWIEVVLLPAWVAILGITWLQAAAWRIDGVQARGVRASVVGPLIAVVALLLVFQLLLRPGIAFY